MQDKLSAAIKIQKLAIATLLQRHGEDYPGVVVPSIAISGLLTNKHNWDDSITMERRL